MIKIRSLSKTYGRATALADVDLTVDCGKVLGLIGTNGSGRTTLLDILATLLRPTSGFVEIDGVDALKFPFEVRPKIGYIPESYGFYDHLTVGEFLEFVADCRKVKVRADKLSFFTDGAIEGLKPDTAIGLLSRGLRQQLAWAAALIHAPLVLLLDEPMSYLDPIAAARFESLLKGVRSEGGTIVLACNRIADIQTLCDEIAFLHHGRLLKVMKVESFSINPSEVLQSLIAQNGSTDSGTQPHPTTMATRGDPT